MSDPVEPQQAAHPRHRYPAELSPDQQAQMDRVVELTPEQTEAYLRWLETGEGPDPCIALFD
jgi:hypothetical protein